MDTPVAKTCPKCGARFSGRALDGLCPACVARRTLATEASSEQLAVSPGAQATPTRLRYFGDYELLEEIARGGMGVVYKARQLSLNRVVAVKLVLAGQLASAADVQRFRSEAEAAANLHHPNIVAIHEVGDHEGHHFFSMDYIAGKSLADVAVALRTNEDFKRAARWLKIIAEAIHYAHQQGTLHRDLKPSNILIDGLDQPRVTDFGLAKRVKSDSDLTVSGQVLGTPNFMPPEQAAGKRGAVGPHSDVYSLGAILYFLLTGKAPFVADSVHETLLQVMKTEPAPPRSLNPVVPRDLETIALKCLAKEPPRRYQSAQELAADLNRFLLDEPILARPAAPVEKLLRTCRRHRLVTSLVVALLLLPVAVGLVVRHYGGGSLAPARQTFEPKPIAQMPTRSGNGVSGVIEGRIYVTSPAIGAGPYRKFLHVYDPKANSWKRLADSGRAHANAAAGVISGKLFVAGGSSGDLPSDPPCDGLEVYDPHTDTWTAKAPMPTGRENCAGAVLNGKLYVVGGLVGTNVFSTVESYDPANDRWITEPSLPIPRASCGVAVIKGTLYVVGGGRDPDTPVKTIDCWEPGGDWVTLRTDNILVPVNNAFVAASADGVLYVLGGAVVDGGPVAVSQIFHSNRIWDFRREMPAVRYAGCGAHWINDELWVFGGWTRRPANEALPHSDVFVYNPRSNSWRRSVPR